jgi:hypothetical protein
VGKIFSFPHFLPACANFVAEAPLVPCIHGALHQRYALRNDRSISNMYRVRTTPTRAAGMSEFLEMPVDYCDSAPWFMCKPWCQAALNSEKRLS